MMHLNRVFAFSCLLSFASLLYSQGIKSILPAAGSLNASKSVGFEENKGQYPSEVKFRLDIGGGTLWVEECGLTYSICDLSQVHPEDGRQMHDAELRDQVIHCDAFKVSFQGASAHPMILTNGRSTQYNSYFVGEDSTKWAREAHLYAEVIYHQLYEGIDLVLKVQDGALKYEFHLSPHANPNAISMKYEGQRNLSIDASGNLVMETTLGAVIDQAPRSWNSSGAEEYPVESAYKIDGNVATFHFPNGYDERLPLVIDPTVVFSTYFPFVGTAYAYCVTYDKAGCAYAAGVTFHATWPSTAGAFDMTFGWGQEVGLFKMNPFGTDVVWSCFMGGMGLDYPSNVITNEAGELFVYGYTDSSGFPVTAGAYQPTYGGHKDIFLSHLSASGTSLIGSTYLGGNASDGFNHMWVNEGDANRGEILLDRNSNLVVASFTSSSDFPVTPGSYDVSPNGNQDGVIAKLDDSLRVLLWSTFLGGINADAPYGIRLADDSSIYVSGGTFSNNFPTTPGAHRTGLGGLSDGFICHLNMDASSILHSTYLGTSNLDQAYLLDIGPTGSIYVIGQTAGSWPIIGAGIYNVPNGHVFISRLNASLSTVTLSTCLGGIYTGPKFSPIGFMIDHCGRIYFSGQYAPAAFPVTADALKSTTDNEDLYVAQFDPGFTTLLYGTYYGNNKWDHVDGGTFRFDKGGIVYITDCVNGTGLPVVPDPGAYGYGPPAGAGRQIAVLKLQFDRLAGMQVNEFDSCAPHSLTFTNLSSGSGIDTAYWDFGDGTPILYDTSSVVSHTYSSPGSYVVTLTVSDRTACPMIDSMSWLITVHPNPTPTITQVGSTLQTSGGGTYQWYESGSPIPGATASTYTPTASGIYTVQVTTPKGCTGISDPFDFLVSVAQPDPSQPLQFWPNPGNEFLNIELPTGAEKIMLMNSTGVVVLQASVMDDAIAQGILRLDLPELADGIYWLIVETEEGRKAAKWIRME